MRKLTHLARLGWSYRTRATTLNHPPYQYTIEPTNICNLRCDFCPQSDPKHAARRKQGHLTIQNLDGFLDDLGIVQPGNHNLNFTLDGEPLLNPHFPELIAQAAKRGLFSVFASNATLLPPTTSDRLVAAGPFRASVDFASEQEAFEAVRGRPGDFATVLGNLRHLARQAGDHRGVHLDIHDITPYTGADPAASLARLRGLFPADLPARVRFDTREFHNFCGHLELPRKQENYRLCPYPWTQMAIAHNGDAVACCRDTVGRSVMGNVFRDGIMGVWNNAAYRDLRQNLIDGRPDLVPACKDCDLPWSGGSARWQPGYMIRSLLQR